MYFLQFFGPAIGGPLDYATANPLSLGRKSRVLTVTPLKPL